MALRKNNYPIIVDGGLNTKTDPALAAQGQALVLENAIFDEVGAIKKRCGFVDLNLAGSYSVDPDIISNHNGTIFLDEELRNQSKYFYTGDGWFPHPYGSEYNPERRYVYSSWMAFIDEKVTNRIKAFYPFMDECTDEDFRIVGHTTYDQDPISPVYTVNIYKSYKTHDRKIKLFSVASSSTLYGLEFRRSPGNPDYIHAFYVVASGANWQLKHVYININTAVSVSTNLSTYPSATGQQGFCTILVGNNILIACDKTNATTTNFSLMNSTGTVISTTDVALANAHIASEKNCYSLCTNGNYVYCFFRNTTALNTVTYIGLDTTGNAISIYRAETTIATSLTSRRISSIYYTTTSSIFVLIENWNSTTGFNVALEYAFVNPASGASTVYSLYPGMNIASKLFKIANDTEEKIYFVGQSAIPNEERYYLCAWNGITGDIHIFGQFAVNGQAGLIKKTLIAGVMDDLFGIYNLPEVNAGLRDGDLFYPCTYVARNTGLNTDLDNYNVANMYVVRFDYRSEYAGINAKLGGNNYIAGALCIEYDTRRFLEQGFLDSNYIIAEQSATAGSLSGGEYRYTGIYEFIDNNGQIHRSGTFNIAVVTAIVSKSVKVTFFYQTPQNYSPAWGAKEMNVIIYRTEVNGSIFYRLGASRGAMLYGPKSYTFTDSVGDADLESGQRLYTDGGILDNNPLPPTKFIMVANNRLFAISSEDENEIFFSQPYLKDECVNFSFFLSLRADAGLLNDNGKCIGLGTLDDKIILFKDNSIAFFYGDGPNQAGLQNSFSDPKLITSNVGLKDPKSIVSIPDGLMFKSTKGIYLLDRSMSLQYIGAAVEDYNNEKVVGSATFSDKHMAMFLTSQRMLVFDYLVNKWTVWTIGGRSICLYNGVPVLIDNTGKVVLYTEGTYLDVSSRYSLKIATSWIKLDGIQNFQRVYRIIMFGAYYSAHSLTVKTYYDYDDTDFDTYTINPSNLDSIYQYEIHLKKQKCQAIKIEIADVSTTGTNQSYKLSNITAVIGKKEGINKIDDSRRY